MTRELYAGWLDRLWSGPLSQLESIAAEVVAPDFVGHWPGRPGHVHGPDELAGIIREGRTMFDDLTFQLVVGPIGEGDLIAARWLARGHYEGILTAFHGHDILRHTGGRIVEYWSVSEQPAQASE